MPLPAASTRSTSIPSILIIDDTQENISLLSDCLKPKFQVLAANNGEKGLAIANRLLPDLILLDIMMPGMDGYEVCEQLKSQPETAHIPVIFLTALYEANDEYKGLSFGAVDYISKPFNSHVLISRVNTQLKLVKAKKELHDYAYNLEDLVREKSSELVKAYERLKVLDTAKQDYLSVISHELRTPLNGVLGFAELAFLSLEETKENLENYQAFEESRDRLMQTIEDAMLLAELQSSDSHQTLKAIELSLLLQDGIAANSDYFRKKNIRFDMTGVASAKVRVDRQLINSSFKALFHAAINMAQPDSRIRLKGRLMDESYLLVISFSCDHLEESFLESFFDVFTGKRAQSHLEELGLRIPLASRIIEALGGAIAIENGAPETVEISLQLLAS